MLTSFELAGMVVMLRNMLGGVAGVMLKFLELAYMVDAGERPSKPQRRT